MRLLGGGEVFGGFGPKARWGRVWLGVWWRPRVWRLVRVTVSLGDSL